jgi:hypothetical protein
MEVLCDPAALCLSQTFGGASRLGDRSWGQVPGVFRAAQGNTKAICWPFVKPSDGLEPSTPSLPCAPKPLPWVATGCGLACLSRCRGRLICDRLPPVAPARFHKCSILRYAGACASVARDAEGGRSALALGRLRRGVFTSLPDLTQAITTDQLADDTDHPVEPTRLTRRYPTHVAHRQSG